MSSGEAAIPETFEMHLAVQSGDIDILGHVNNIVYLRWVQDIAIAHWRARAPQEDQNALYWVVTRHEIDYKRSAMPGESILARTWIGKASRFAFERHTEILRAADGKLLVKALTLWCPMSRTTNKPVDVRPEVRALFAVGPLA